MVIGHELHLGSDGQGAVQLAVELEVNLPGVEAALAQELANAAHQACPYSKATRGNIDVTVTVVDD